ncbi:hypothetical protein TSUD_374350 [Trifolium subterraneum]|uniref:Uncharacterized protein n=1 Tax=Trifolium subterraneum TaxID=3900 RepID=A0A2Z6P111_TRISU|nr:hypothetical protein TSUD_374350 [Trifolium subterraneum]
MSVKHTPPNLLGPGEDTGQSEQKRNGAKWKAKLQLEATEGVIRVSCGPRGTIFKPWFASWDSCSGYNNAKIRGTINSINLHDFSNIWQINLINQRFKAGRSPSYLLAAENLTMKSGITEEIFGFHA